MAMKPSTTRRLAILAASVLAVGGTLAATLPASAATPGAGAHAATKPPATPGTYYLALGDSVSFGYREATNLPTPDYTDAHNFKGFPEDVARQLGLKLANASCPGETSASLVNQTKQSNGCESQPGGGPGYRSVYPLHVSYATSQLQYGIQFLKSHPTTRLITLMVGANDGFLCQETTPDHCTDPSELGAVLTTVETNVKTILSRIRNKAGYKGQIVIVNYYSTNYADPNQTSLSKLLNTGIKTAATPYDVKFATGFRAFHLAAEQAGGDTCAAGLLTILSGGGCGVHPSIAGQSLLAGAVERVTHK